MEIQAQVPLFPEDREDAVQKMESEFRAKRKILIMGLPHDYIEEVSAGGYKMLYGYQYSAHV